MLVEAGIWVLFGVCALLYLYVSKSFISQPDWNVPRIFHNHTVAKLLIISPQVGLAAVAILGFMLTEHGWWYLGAVIAAVVVLT
jgi:hypothetical protein